MLSDSELIRKIKNGCVQKFSKLVERYRTPVFALAYRMLGTREDAEDAAQDVFLRALQSIHTFSTDSDFWPWIRRITINCCLRKLPREYPSDDIDELVEAQQMFIDTVQAEVFREYDKQYILDAISALPQDYRIVIVMKYQGEMTSVEIAECLGESAGSIRVRLHRALKALSKELAVVDNEL